MPFQDAVFKHSEGPLYHGGAIAYALVAYALGLLGLFSDAWLVNFGAVLLLAHAMTIAAYMSGWVREDRRQRREWPIADPQIRSLMLGRLTT